MWFATSTSFTLRLVFLTTSRIRVGRVDPALASSARIPATDLLLSRLVVYTAKVGEASMSSSILQRSKLPMSETMSVSGTENRYEQTLSELCYATIERVSMTDLGTLVIDTSVCFGADLEMIDSCLNIKSVERKGSGLIRIVTKKQVAPCINGRY